MTCHFLLSSPHSPNPHSSTKFPAHIHPFEDSPHLRQHFTALLHRLLSPTGKRIVIIHDALMASVVQDSVSIPNTESYAFKTVSAFISFFDLWEALGKPFQIEVEVFRAGDLINTNRSMEDTYIDLLENFPGNKKYWAVRSINPVTICSKHGNSNNEQINENAISLEQSNTKFIWVLRYADKADIFTEECRRSAKLPEGFEKRTKGMGMIVRDWTPQLEILGHPSTGGFMSQCGWNSCLESLSMGVPIVAWPMHSDQPKNVVLISEVLRVGVIVKKWTHIGNC
ncbi:hypothetical protein EZV62_005245 [Acer yangbiense]|uniref:Glycosyltransferase N-terminal domain-containing protein n=1 Tax=Acer yangbiense TaxID=1000413 RepID=A0A5C7IMA3_9ROSI|nr:hypothetical protein EZV62_005245 [Acer yangbiense]